MPRLFLCLLCCLSLSIWSIGCDEDHPADAGADGDGDSDADGDSGPDADAPSGLRFVLHFISDVPESIWIAEGTPELHQRFWLRVFRGELPVRIAPSCECSCDQCPCELDCEAPCRSVTEVPHATSVEYQWDGVEYLIVDCPADPGASCQRQMAAPAGTHTARFCWGDSSSGAENCAREVQNVQCDDVEFELPDPDGVVELTVNYSG